MMLLPAIDLVGGRCVRLAQGDFARETAYDADPAEALAGFAGGGAIEAHLVDLDGAALVIHAKADDYQTDPSGASGDRIACAVLEG